MCKLLLLWQNEAAETIQNHNMTHMRTWATERQTKIQNLSIANIATVNMQNAVEMCLCVLVCVGVWVCVFWRSALATC